VSDFATTLCAPDRGGLTVGFLTHERFFNHVALRSDGAQVRELLACVPVESCELAPRSTLRAERLWIGIDRPGSDGIATWAEHTALEMGVRTRPGATLAWSSRNAQLGDRGVFALREALSALRDLDAGVELIEIEQGYQSQLGDWLAPSDGFPEGIAPVCRELARGGFQSGVWIAPFVASLDSELVKKHAGWRLCEADGAPSPPFRLPGLATPCVALDPGNPELRGWLAELTRTLHGAGAQRLRLDWLVTGARSIPRPGGETTVEAYRGALRAMREAAPETPWLVASRAPIGPSIGLIDAMRSGPELDTAWRAQGGWLRRGEPAPGAERAVCNALARAPLGRLWQLDPDCLVLGETDNPLSSDELLTAAAVALLCGGLVSFSGTIRDFSAERCDLLRRLLPSLRRTPEIGAPVAGADARLLTRFPDGSLLVLLPNLGSAARSFELDLAQLGLKGPHHLWDALAQRWLGVILDRWESERVPPRSSLLLRFSPDDGKPRVIGSTLHLGAGAIEVGRLRSEPDGTLALQLRQPGRRSGSIALVTGRGAAATVGVTFDHQLELRVRSSGLPEEAAPAAGPHK
jgi:alpha-galactosidase